MLSNKMDNSQKNTDHKISLFSDFLPEQDSEGNANFMRTCYSETGVNDDRNITAVWSHGELKIHENVTSSKDDLPLGKSKKKFFCFKSLLWEWIFMKQFAEETKQMLKQDI